MEPSPDIIYQKPHYMKITICESTSIVQRQRLNSNTRKNIRWITEQLVQWKPVQYCLAVRVTSDWCGTWIIPIDNIKQSHPRRLRLHNALSPAQQSSHVAQNRRHIARQRWVATNMVAMTQGLAEEHRQYSVTSNSHVPQPFVYEHPPPTQQLVREPSGFWHQHISPP